MTNTRTLSQQIHVVRDELADRRRNRRSRSQLRRELASYTTRSDVDDLLAMVAGNDSRDAAVIRELLLANRSAGSWPRSASWV
jgi:hypothetical protein